MLFNSYVFVLAFLPLTLALRHIGLMAALSVVGGGGAGLHRRAAESQSAGARSAPICSTA